MEFINTKSEDKFDVDLYNEYDYLEKHFGLQQRFINFINVECRVEWSLSLECRSWGVKDISPYVTKVSATMFVELEREEMIDELTKIMDASLDPKIFNDKTFEYEFELDLEKFEITTERDGTNHDGFTKTQMNVETVQIDFDDNTIIVNL